MLKKKMVVPKKFLGGIFDAVGDFFEGTGSFFGPIIGSVIVLVQILLEE